MRAAWFERFGPAGEVLKVGEQPDPVPGPGEVLVALRTSGVNPSDVKKRAGSSASLLDEGLVIPHSDGAGVIAAVGHGVDRKRIGERVWVYQAQYARRFGTAAGYVAIDGRRAPVLAEAASFEVGACLGIPVMTAHRCVFADGSVKGQHLLVTGGAGRVGWYAIQWAKGAGAFVIATAGSDTDRQACLNVGADAVVNHRAGGWGAQVLEATGGRRIDRAVDVEFGANLTELLECVRTGATIATYSSTLVREPKLPFGRMMFMDLTIRMVIVYAMPEEAKTDAMRDIDAALRKDRLKHRVAHLLPLDQIARSHQLIENRGFGGCVLLKVAEQ